MKNIILEVADIDQRFANRDEFIEYLENLKGFPVFAVRYDLMRLDKKKRS